MGKIKITKKLLDEYRKTKIEIPLLEQELHEMWTMEKGFGNSVILNGKNGSKKPETVVGFDQERYERRKLILQNKREKARVVERWINSIEDVETRMVFKMYYTERLGFETISIKLGRIRSGDYIRMYIRDKFLKENEIF
jgi:hypothetical protein